MKLAIFHRQATVCQLILIFVYSSNGFKILSSDNVDEQYKTQF